MTTWLIINQFNPKLVWTKAGWDRDSAPLEFSHKNVMLPRDGEWSRSPKSTH